MVPSLVEILHPFHMTKEILKYTIKYYERNESEKKTGKLPEKNKTVEKQIKTFNDKRTSKG